MGAELGALLLGIGLAVGIRTFLVALYSIPSESMLPGLWPGDLLIVDAWPFRALHHLPARGDVVMFRAPPRERRTYVKRVIGLPGDVVALRGGVPIVNGSPFARWRITDLSVPVAPATPCRIEPGHRIVAERGADGRIVCRYPRYRERLPDGRADDVLDLGAILQDDFGPVRVPAGHLFLLGDNRDRSADSRYPAQEGGGIGMVPVGDLIGRVGMVLFSSDGSAHWTLPASWWRAIRWERIGMRF